MKLLKRAFLSTVPVLTGYVILGIGFGLLLGQAGFGIGWSLGMSVFIYAGSMQYVGIELLRQELGEPDEKGRRSPVPVPGSEWVLDCETVILPIGTSPNPLIAKTTAGLETTRRGCLSAGPDGATTRPGIFAGGDAVTGAATVILAMGAGRAAAKAIDEYLKNS